MFRKIYVIERYIYLLKSPIDYFFRSLFNSSHETPDSIAYQEDLWALRTTLCWRTLR